MGGPREASSIWREADNSWSGTFESSRSAEGVGSTTASGKVTIDSSDTLSGNNAMIIRSRRGRRARGQASHAGEELPQSLGIPAKPNWPLRCKSWVVLPAHGCCWLLSESYAVPRFAEAFGHGCLLQRMLL